MGDFNYDSAVSRGLVLIGYENYHVVSGWNVSFFLFMRIDKAINIEDLHLIVIYMILCYYFIWVTVLSVKNSVKLQFEWQKSSYDWFD